MKQRDFSLDGTGNVQINKIWTAIGKVTQTSLVRNVVVSAAIMIAALFVVFGVANADKPLTPVSAVKSPIPQPVTVILDCQETWNPSCTPTAATTSGAKLYSYFYIDGRYRGTANKTYANVCARYYLRDGVHTARVYAVDAHWNSASVGPYKVIHCDRFAPSIATYLWYGRHWKVNIVPYAADYGSGIATKTFSVDGVVQPWKSYTDACTQMSLAKGWRKTKVTATDIAGNSVTGGMRTFYCP
jgi:hypothetical protein